MTPSRRVCFSAICCGWLLLLASAPALAQSYEDGRRFLDLSPEPLARSPRGLGMGRLTLVANDAHSRIGLWSFAGNPTGIVEEDSISTLEIAPGSSSASSVHYLPGFQPAYERQDLGAREVRFQFEAWRRATKQTAYGLIGDFGFLRYDRPFDEITEHRSNYSQPRVSPIVNGDLPFLAPGRIRYAVRGIYGYQSLDELYKIYTFNGSGAYLDQDGLTIDPPDFFTPDQSSVRTLGVGSAVSWKIATPFTISLGFDHVSNAIRGVNEGGRYASENSENRPYENLQLSSTAKLGQESGVMFEHGSDLRRWTSKSDANWVFTISAGTGSQPITNRGKLLEREEDGWLLRERVKLTAGSLEIGAGYNQGRRKVSILEPRGRDYQGSFNRFLNVLSSRPGADTLSLPDSVRSHEVEEKAWEAAGGVAWNFPGRRAVVGIEFHTGEEESTLPLRSLTVSGNSATALAGSLDSKRVTSELRAGLEYLVLPTLSLRGGYLRRNDDLDDLTEGNEFVSNGMTLGFGLHPAATRWSIETGYVVEWSQADYGDPREPHGSRQQFDTRIRWGF